ncbi:MAG: hypothetical protein LBK60_11175 [Verrucomicrobiales bacterium]|jgi:hypothetical protein|nr:hypothetical protein [Verrucomicrobiales bacterium]
MNTLSYHSSLDNGFLAFELFVDGVAFGEILGNGYKGIPYWNIENDLPHCPPHGASRNLDFRIVTVCSCGEYGCGHSRCRVIKTAETVTFCDFTGDVSTNSTNHVFVFSHPDYQCIVNGIIAEARHQKQKYHEK